MNYNLSVVVQGPSGIGKTYALRKAFGIDGVYGYKRVTTGKTPVATLGRLHYIPELRNTRHNKEAVMDGFVSLLTREGVAVTDLNTTAPFAKRLLQEHSIPYYVTLTATDSEIRDRVMARPSAPNATLTKEEVIAKSIANRDYVLDNTFCDEVMTQEEFVEYLRDIAFR